MASTGDEWPAEEYARRLREAFQRADRSGAGLVSRRELADLVQELDGRHWSDEELGEFLDAVDEEGTGFVKYAHFIAFLMGTKVEEEEPEEEGEERPDGWPCAAPPDLDQQVDLGRCLAALRLLADDEEEEAQEALKRQQDGANRDSLPLRALLSALRAPPGDGAAAWAAAAVAAGPKPELPAPGESALARALHQLARSLHQQERPAGDATRMLSEGLVPLSKAECAAAQALGREPGRLAESLGAFLRDPPMLSALAGLRACEELCSQEVGAIMAKCKAAGRRFTDHSWDLAAAPAQVLYVDGCRPGYDCTVGRPSRVRRLSRILATSALAPSAALSALYGGGAAAARATGAAPEAPRAVLARDGRPGEIMQGQIGTCYLLGAMGAVAASGPDAIRSLFVKYDIDVGVYGVRFNIDGEWRYVVVDDHMPVDEHGELLYARGVDPAEVWCPILEKAFCKLHGCYEMCDGGQTSQALEALVGGVSGRLRVAPRHREEPERFFRLLKAARSRGWLLTADFSAPGEPATGSSACGAARARGKCGESVLPFGLIAGHAYSVLQLIEAGGQQLVCLRNPWGCGEWTGKWSDRNSQGEWTEEMRRAAGFVGADDGVFWMSIQDFVTRSNGVDYTRAFGPDWRQVTQYSRFRKGELLATANCDYAAATEEEISFSAGDQIQVAAVHCGSFWWRGRVWRVRVSASGKSKEGYFPAGRVQVNQHPVACFDLHCRPTSTEAMTVVVLLSQPNAAMQRRFFRRREDGLACKDVHYPRLQLSILSPEGKTIAQRAGRRRCLWVELELPSAGCWRLQALSLDGLGGAFALRAYAKDGEARLVPASIDENEK